MTSKMAQMENERILRRIPLEILVISLIISLPLIVLYDAFTAMLFFLGGSVSALNFLWMRETVFQVLSRDKKKAVTLGIASYILRILLICSIFFIIIFFLSERIIAFVAGLSTIILIFLAEAAAALVKQRKWKS